MKKLLLFLSAILVTTSAFAASTLTTTAEAHVSHVQKLNGVLRTADKNGMQIPGFGGKK